MGKFASVLLALVHFGAGPAVFYKSEAAKKVQEPETILVLVSLGVLLWGLRIYPKRLRKQCWGANFLCQFMTALFLIEISMAKIWPRWEKAVVDAPKKVGDFLGERFQCIEHCAFLKQPLTGKIFNYIIICLFLLCILHATRLLNFHILLKYGLKPFVMDICGRCTKFARRSISTTSINSDDSDSGSDFCSGLLDLDISSVENSSIEDEEEDDTELETEDENEEDEQTDEEYYEDNEEEYDDDFNDEDYEL